MPTGPDLDDPDLAHLFDLLGALPAPREATEFWTAVQHQALGSGTALGYVFQKLTGIGRTAREPTPANITDLARYLLFFFAGDNPALWKILNGLFPDLTLHHDEAGRLWASDVSQTAWTLFVRYRAPGRDPWLDAWQADDWREWLPPRAEKDEPSSSIPLGRARPRGDGSA
jgi:hypothetical protein